MVVANTNNWASNIGHPCFRYLYLKRTSPELEIIPEEKRILFQKGIETEELVINEFRKEGFEIVELQKRFELKEYKITGKIDCIIKYATIRYPCEIKSVSDSNWKKIYTYKDFLESEYYYIRMYPVQLQLYLFATESEKGYFYLRNKNNSQGRFIKVIYDKDVVDATLKKAAGINSNVERNIIPPPINDTSICNDCGFYNYCYKNNTIA